MSTKNFFTIKEWKIEQSPVEDILVVIHEAGAKIQYDVPMEEAMMVLARTKTEIRHHPDCDYFEVTFGGKRHGFTLEAIIKFCDELKTAINVSMANRVNSVTFVFKSTTKPKIIIEPEPDTADTNFLKMPESVSTTPDLMPSMELPADPEKPIVDIVSGTNEVAKGRGRKKK